MLKYQRKVCKTIGIIPSQSLKNYSFGSKGKGELEATTLNRNEGGQAKVTAYLVLIIIYLIQTILQETRKWEKPNISQNS